MTNTDIQPAESKPWYASKTIWAGIVGASMSVAAMVFGFQANNGDILQIVDSMQKIGEGVAVVIGGVTSLIAVYGRRTAKMPITKKS